MSTPTNPHPLTHTVDPAALTYGAHGLIPVIVQDAATHQVLMLGYATAEAVQRTVDTGIVTFYSRSRQQLWVKGETSGHYLHARALATDCDSDALLIQAEPVGPTCHTGEVSCFDHAPESFLGRLGRVVGQRHTERPEGSYTTSLFADGTRRIAQKVGEEGVETALAAVAQGDAELTGEAADLLFHLLVLLRARGLSMADCEAVLRSRHS